MSSKAFLFPTTTVAALSTIAAQFSSFAMETTIAPGAKAIYMPGLWGGSKDF